MLQGFPPYRYFSNGNSFSGAEGGMRYLLAPGTDADGKKCLCVTVWPGPWSLEHTAEEKCLTAAFAAEQAGLDAATEWLGQQYAEQRGRWLDIPSILDCEPDR